MKTKVKKIISTAIILVCIYGLGYATAKVLQPQETAYDYKVLFHGSAYGTMIVLETSEGFTHYATSEETCLDEAIVKIERDNN